MEENIENELFHVNYENVKRIFFSTDDFFILVDGLSLMLETCLNKHLKWEENGGIYLHFIYCVERILKMLLKLKNFVKVVFFENVDTIIKHHELKSERESFSLAYQLLIFHLKCLKTFKNRLVFYKDFKEYSEDLKNDRIICFMGFSYIDISHISNKELATKLMSHMIRLIQVNLDLGVSVILTKNFWYDSNCANAFIVTKSKHASKIEFQDDRIIQSEMGEKINTSNMSRQSIYLNALDNIQFKYLFQLHIDLLDKIPLSKRKIIEFVPNFDAKYPDVYKEAQFFKLKLANQLKIFNQTIDYYELDENICKQMVDLFDARLFYKTVDSLRSDKTVSASIFSIDYHASAFQNNQRVSESSITENRYF